MKNRINIVNTISGIAYLMFVAMVVYATLIILFDWGGKIDDGLYSKGALIGIFLILLVGVLLGYLFLRDVSSELIIMQEIQTGADDLESAHRISSVASLTYHSLQNIVPKSERGVALRMCHRILRDTRDHIHEHREAVLTQYRDEIRHRLQNLYSIQALALRMGILGTFVGLILAINDISNLFDIGAVPEGGAASSLPGVNDNRQMFSLVSNQLFDSLGIAFGTSIVGLEVAILLTLMIIFLRWRQDYALTMLDTTAGKLLSLARRVTYEEKGLLSSFTKMNSMMEKLEVKINGQLDVTCRSIDTLAQNVAQQSDEIINGLKTMEGLRVEWNTFLSDIQNQQREVFEETLSHRVDVEHSFNGFLDQLEEREKAYIRDLNEVLDLLSVGKLGKDINQSVSSTGQNLVRSIDGQVAMLTDKLIENGNVLRQSIKDEIEALKSELVNSSNVQTQLVSSLNDVDSVSHELCGRMNGINDSLDFIEGLRSNMETTAESLQESQTQLQKDIEESVQRLHDKPLDERLLIKVTEQANAQLQPISENLQRVSVEFQALQQQTSSWNQAATKMNRVLGGRFFKLGFVSLVMILGAAGLSLAALAWAGFNVWIL